MTMVKLFRYLARRRVLPLAVLILWGVQLIVGMSSRPESIRSRLFGQSLPFVGATGAGIDYYQFWIVGRAEEQLPPDNIYSMPNRGRMADFGRELLEADPAPSARFANSVQIRRTIETFSTPFLYAAVNAFASGDYERDYARFIAVALAALALSLAALGWMLEYSALEILLFAAVTWLWCEPLTSDLRVGNVNELQLAGVTLYLLLRRRPEGVGADILSGLVLGLLVAFKPTLGVMPILLALAWIVDRRWRTLLVQGIAAAAGAGAAFVAGCRFLHSWSAWSDWTHSLPDLEKLSDVSVRIGNFSLARVILEATSGPGGPGIAAGPLLLVLMLALAGAALFLTRRRARDRREASGAWFERDFWAVAIGCALSVVALKLAWLHYYILLLPLVLYVLRPWPVPVMLAGTLALAAVFGRPLIFLLEPDPSFAAAIYIAGAWGLLLLGLGWLFLPARDGGAAG